MFTEDEIKLSDPESFKSLRRFLDIGVMSDEFSVDFTIKLAGKVELTVLLPPGYPSWDPEKPVKPIVVLRLLPELSESVNEKDLSYRFDSWLDEATKSGEPVICAAVEWLQEVINTKSQSSKTPDEPTVSALPDSVVCLWIVSHHIRNPVKRRLISEWSAELQLNGVCMPGKPGLVVVEGESEKANEFWRRLRHLQWKHIQVRDRETLGSEGYKSLRFDCFTELPMAHQSRFAWLHEHGVSSDQFKLVFGIPGRLSQS